MRVDVEPMTSAIQDRMDRVTPPSQRQIVEAVGLTAVMLIVTTAIVALLESSVGIADASPVYLLAVVVVASRSGTVAAVATALIAFVVYDVAFTEPRGSLVVADPQEWLDLLIFLLVAVAIGRLAAIERSRALEAHQKAREAASLFAISRLLATTSLAEAAPELARRLVVDAGLTRAWITVSSGNRELRLADTDGATEPPTSAVVTALVRTPGDEPARWIRTHRPDRAPDKGHRELTVSGSSLLLRIGIDVPGESVGAIWATRDRRAGVPGREETRVLALAADQIALAVRRERLRQDATAAEVARQGDALRSALLDSVSHDLRTPLASIRAFAGSLADPAIAWTDDDRRAAAVRIDEEAARLDRLVRGVLDLSRIGAGTLEPELESIDLVAVVETVVERLDSALGDRPVAIELPEELPVLADAVLLETIVTNVLENVARHAPAPAPVRIRAVAVSDGEAVLEIDDGGPGVPDETLAHLVDRFYRAPNAATGSRPGLGIGLSVVHGLATAMGGGVTASRSDLGGLRISVRLRLAHAPQEPAP